MTEETVARHKNARNDLTAEYVRSILDYDPETGEFRWKWRSDVSQRWNTRNAGNKTGVLCGDGRVRLTIKDRKYLMHRIAWLYMTGEWPAKEIDHVDGNPANNKISNLRECSSVENMRYRGMQANNACGMKGVHWAKNVQKWRSRLKFEGKTFT